MKTLHIDQLFTSDDGSVGYALAATDLMRAWQIRAHQEGEWEQSDLWREAGSIWAQRALDRD